MADQGPLVAPGWPSTLPGAPDLGKTFLTAFQVGSEVNRRKQQLENQMALYALRAQKMELDRTLDEKKFLMAQDAQQRRIEHQADMLDFYKMREERIAGDVKNALDWQKEKFEVTGEARDALSDVRAQLAAEHLFEGDKGYPERAIELFNSNPYTKYLPSSSSNAWWKSLYNNHNAKATENTRTFETYRKAFDYNAREITRGGALEGGINRILDYEKLPDETKTEGGKQFGWWTVGGKQVPTGRKKVQVRAADGTLTEEAVPVERLQELRNQYQTMTEMQRKLAPVVERPDLGVYPPTDTRTAAPAAASREERARAALTDPEANDAEKAAARRILGIQ
jgi:hypothetical protein